MVLMTIFFGILLGIVIFMILVIIHEWGHFFAARKSGVKVLEFGIGIPPKAKYLGKDKKGTEYTLNRIPFGGFMRPKGEDPKDPDDFNAPDSLISASFPRKAIIMLAGIAMNFLLAWVILTILFTIGTKPLSVLPDGLVKMHVDSSMVPTVSNLQTKGFDQGYEAVTGNPVVVQGIASGSVFVGLQTGFAITKLNNIAVTTKNFYHELTSYTGNHLLVGFMDSTKIYQTRVVDCDGQCVLGLMIDSAGIHETFDEIANKTIIHYPFVQAMGSAAHEIRWQTSMTFNIMGTLVKNTFSGKWGAVQQQVQGFSSPIGIVNKLIDFISPFDITKILLFMAMISIALGAFNLLPIPALDGGRLLTAFIQWVFRLPKEKFFVIEGYVNMVFFVFLLLLGVGVMYKDVVQLVIG